MVEQYSIDNGMVTRRIIADDGHSYVSTLQIPNGICATYPPEQIFDYIWLTSKTRPQVQDAESSLNMADLFCGLGPMSLGVIEAGRALNIDITPVFALDFEKDAALSYKLNFPSANVVNTDVNTLINGNLGELPTQEEINLLSSLPKIDIVIGGPPCQGHSDLNNYTRRNDPRNFLIFKLIRFVELTNPNYVIIENVQGIRHDKNKVLDTAKEFLTTLGYKINEHLLLAKDYGVPQNRRRFLLTATKSGNVYNTATLKRKAPTTVSWAISDLENISVDSADTFNTASVHSEENQKRIDFLHDNDVYELPYFLRPACQCKPDNRYTSVYSRIYPNGQAPTITSGFGSIGQGRFGHPTKRRSITPHEAARLQFIPDFYIFPPGLKRVSLQKLIGNAVPPKLTYILALNLLSC